MYNYSKKYCFYELSIHQKTMGKKYYGFQKIIMFSTLLISNIVEHQISIE